jgi:hypothetical protein
MNDDYLWDRTGEPDKELQQLEELLAELRFQPRPLHIPHHVRLGRRRFAPVLAIAATLLIAVAIGIWLKLNRRSVTPPQQAGKFQPVQPDRTAPINTGSENLTATIANPPKPNKPERHPMIARSSLTNKRPRSVIREPELTAQELAQKEQVVLALRMVSAKLNLAQRKTQGVPQTNIIRNQHKIG